MILYEDVSSLNILNPIYYSLYYITKLISYMWDYINILNSILGSIIISILWYRINSIYTSFNIRGNGQSFIIFKILYILLPSLIGKRILGILKKLINESISTSHIFLTFWINYYGCHHFNLSFVYFNSSDGSRNINPLKGKKYISSLYHFKIH